MDIQREYQAKLTVAEQAVKVVKSGYWVDYSFATAQPISLDNALAARKDELWDIKIRGGLILSPLAVVEADPSRKPAVRNSTIGLITMPVWHPIL